MEEFIKELGFWGYMQQYPINPITIVTIVIIIGIIVLFINGTIKRRKATQFLAQNAGAAIMTFHKKQIGSNDYADNIRIVRINNEPTSWFFLKPAIPAVYLKPGENHIELYAEWARGGMVIRMSKTDVKTIIVTAETEGRYSLEYYIPEDNYRFETYENERLFGKKKK